MEYKFKKIDTDIYQLIYTNTSKEEIVKEFKRTNEYRAKLESTTKEARLRLAEDLAKRGKKPQDFFLTTKDDKGHTYQDESIYNQLERDYINDVQNDVLDEILADAVKEPTRDLFLDMGIDMNNIDKISQEDVQEVLAFLTKFTTIINGTDDKTTPSDKE